MDWIKLGCIVLAFLLKGGGVFAQSLPSESSGTFLFYLSSDGPSLEREAALYQNILQVLIQRKAMRGIILWDPPSGQSPRWTQISGGEVRVDPIHEKLSMGDPRWLGQLIKRRDDEGWKEGPQYLILSGHGRGPWGFAYDYAGRTTADAEEYDGLTLEEIQQVLNKNQATHPDQKWDAIFYLGCWMGNLNWVLGHVPYANVLVANPGLDLAPDLGQLFDASGKISQSYFEKSSIHFSNLKSPDVKAPAEVISAVLNSHPGYVAYHLALASDAIEKSMRELREVFAKPNADQKVKLRDPYQWASLAKPLEKDLHLEMVDWRQVVKGLRNSDVGDSPGEWNWMEPKSGTINVWWPSRADWNLQKVRRGVEVDTVIESLFSPKWAEDWGWSWMFHQWLNGAFAIPMDHSNESWSKYFDSDME